MSVKKSVDLNENFVDSSNCFLKDGTLTPGYVFNKLSSFNDVIYAAYSNHLGKIIVCTAKAIYTSLGGAMFTRYADLDISSPFLVEEYFDGSYRCGLITGSTAALFVDNGIVKIDLKEKFDCGVMHCGRLFAVSGLTLWWSGPDGLADWKAGIGGCGKLDLDPSRGSVLNMLVFGGKIVVMRNYGLTVLSMNGSPENFSVDTSDTDCDSISRNTAQVFEGKLYFYSMTGLKCFDGSKIYSVKTRHTVSSSWSSAVFGDRYFLAARRTSFGRDVIMCVDLKDGESCILEERADMLLKKNMVYFFNSAGCHSLAAGGTFSFQSEADFGTGRAKALTKIECDGSPKIKVSNGKFTRRFSGSCVRPHMRGKHFTFTIEHDKPVKWVTAYAEVTDGI